MHLIKFKHPYFRTLIDVELGLSGKSLGNSVLLEIFHLHTSLIETEQKKYTLSSAVASNITDKFMICMAKKRFIAHLPTGALYDRSSKYKFQLCLHDVQETILKLFFEQTLTASCVCFYSPTFGMDLQRSY